MIVRTRTVLQRRFIAGEAAAGPVQGSEVIEAPSGSKPAQTAVYEQCSDCATHSDSAQTSESTNDRRGAPSQPDADGQCDTVGSMCAVGPESCAEGRGGGSREKMGVEGVKCRA